MPRSLPEFEYPFMGLLYTILLLITHVIGNKSYNFNNYANYRMEFEYLKLRRNNNLDQLRVIDLQPIYNVFLE